MPSRHCLSTPRPEPVAVTARFRMSTRVIPGGEEKEVVGGVLASRQSWPGGRVDPLRSSASMNFARGAALARGGSRPGA
jgi:hypothetical protein